MHGSWPPALILAVALHCDAVAAGAQPPGAELQESFVPDGVGAPAMTCDPRRACRFVDTRAENEYTVDPTHLTRRSGGRPLYKTRVAGGAARVLLGATNEQRTTIVLAVGMESLPVGALFNPGTLNPSSVQRQFTLSLRNPKSGDEIKAIDLGAFRPTAIGLTSAGDYAWLVGEELQLRRQEARVYNTRAGALEASLGIKPGQRVALFQSGISLDGRYYTLPTTQATGDRRFLSTNPYSIAEFMVKTPAVLPVKTLASVPIAILRLEGVTPDVGDLLESAVAVKLATRGLKLVERQRVKEVLQELQFQTLGLTDSATAIELGRLAAAQYLLAGRVQQLGSVTTMNLRMVRTEDGTITGSAELECRDCRPDDYVQGLGYLLNEWIR